MGQNDTNMQAALLLFHVVCGAIALLTGLIAIISKKGNKLHVNAGKIFFWAMFAVGISSLVLAIVKFNPFLLSLGVFSMYMVISGRRALFYYNLVQNYKPKLIDILPIYMGLLTALFMLLFSAYQMLIGDGNIVLMVFGLILLFLSTSDLKVLIRNREFAAHNKQWIFKHIGMMLGTYIAATTAFLVNTVQFNPPWVLWLGPTVLGVLLMRYFNNIWKGKISKT